MESVSGWEQQIPNLGAPDWCRTMRHRLPGPCPCFPDLLSQEFCMCWPTPILLSFRFDIKCHFWETSPDYSGTSLFLDWLPLCSRFSTLLSCDYLSHWSPRYPISLSRAGPLCVSPTPLSTRSLAQCLSVWSEETRGRMLAGGFGELRVLPAVSQPLLLILLSCRLRFSLP